MNPLSPFSKCARLTLVLAVSTSLIFAVGCGNFFGGGGGGGGGSSRQLLNGSYSKSSLNGHYVFSLSGIAINQANTGSDFFSEMVVFTADGNGKLTVTVDDFMQSGQPFGLHGSTFSGTYSIFKDGTGALSFNQSNYEITLVDTSHFYVSQQDQFASGFGTGEKQDTSALSSRPIGTFVFKTHDLGSNVRVGGIAIDSNGNVSGHQDQVTGGVFVPNSSINTTNPLSAPDADGHGSFTLSDNTQFFYYVVNAGKFRILSETGSLEIGQAEAQTGGPFSLATLGANSSFAFGTAGETANIIGGVHSAGVFTTGGDGSVTAGTVDWVQDGAVSSNVSVVADANAYSLASNGRGLLTLTINGGALSPKAFWMVSPTRAYFIVGNPSTVEDGTFSLQQGSAFTNSSLTSQAALVMDGVDAAFKDRIGAFLPDGSGHLKWSSLADSFDPNNGVGLGTLSNQLFVDGTYQVSSNGRVQAVIPTLNNGNDSDLVFYLISNGNGFMVQEDSSVDIGGSFAAQSGH